MPEDDAKFSLGQLMATVLLLLVAILIYFYHLGQADLYQDNPARIALYVEQMNEAGRWLNPVLEGQARYDVPPLYLWLTKVTGLMINGAGHGVDAYAVRFPSAMGAVLIVLLAAFWFHRHACRYGRDDGVETSPESFALLAGLMVATSPMLFKMSRAGTQETLFALFYLAAAFCWGESLEARRSFYAGRSWRTWLMWGYAMAGLALLAGGPVVFALLWVPYILATRSYRLRRPAWIHLAGLALALVIGAWWYLAMMARHPGAAATFWFKLVPPFDNQWSHPGSVLDYLSYIVIGGFPWIVLAGVMIARVLRKQDRSPMLIFWTWSLLGNLLWFWLAGAESERHLLPMIPFISLLAADALHRWNFETFASLVWRNVLRVVLLLTIVGGIFLAALLSSELGVFFYILTAIGWAVWTIRSRIRGVQYTFWETTVRLAAIAVLAILAGEVILASNWEPRKRFHKEILGYFERIDELLPDDGTAKVVLFDDQMQPLYHYHLGRNLPRSTDLAAIQREADDNTYLVSSRKLTDLMRDARLAPLTFCLDSRPGRFREGLFKVIPPGHGSPAVGAAASGDRRPDPRPPLRVGVLGNSGTRTRAQYEVGRQLDHYASNHPVHDTLLLGNNIYGKTVFNHLDFIESFEAPYLRLLKRGVLFHALLGHEDQSYAWLQTSYGPFHMFGRRYYSTVLDGGLAEVFMLDSERLAKGGDEAALQLKWLEEALAATRAPWKVVALHRALLSTAAEARPDAELAAQLLPIFDRHRVPIVLWAGGAWYERLEAAGHGPMFFNAGWSGDSREARFTGAPAAAGTPAAPDIRLLRGYAESAGFIVLEFTAQRAAFEAITDKRNLVDVGEIPLPAPLP